MKKVIQPSKLKEETKLPVKEKQVTKTTTSSTFTKAPASKPSNTASTQSKISNNEQTKQGISQSANKIENGKSQPLLSKITPKVVNTKQQVDLSNKEKQNTQQVKQGLTNNPAQIQIISPNTLKFFEIFDEKIVNKIMSFLQLKDFAKVAIISRKFRNRIPQAIKKQDFSKVLSQLKSNYYSEINLFSRDLYEINKQFNFLIDNSLENVQQGLTAFSKKNQSKSKEGLLDILATGVNFFMNAGKKKVDIVDYILSTGIATVFKPLSYHYILSSQAKITMAQFPDDAKDNALTQLIRLIHKYFTLQQNKKFSIQQQKKGVLNFMMHEYLESFTKLKDAFIKKYERPIMCLKKTSNVFNYLNKNNIQLILPFLSAYEITLLCQSCKSMQELIRQGTFSILENLKEKRKNLLIKHSMLDEQAKAVMYLAAYRLFQSSCEGYIASYLFENKELKELLTMLCKLVSENYQHSETIINKDKSEYVRHYRTGHNIHNAKVDQLENLNLFLSKYSDEFVANGQIEDKFYRNEVIYLQQYLKGFQFYLQQKLNQDQFLQLDQTYRDYIFKIDQSIHRYERIFKLNKEQLDIFVYGLDKPIKQRKIKDISRDLFY